MECEAIERVTCTNRTSKTNKQNIIIKVLYADHVAMNSEYAEMGIAYF